MAGDSPKTKERSEEKSSQEDAASQQSDGSATPEKGYGRSGEEVNGSASEKEKAESEDAKDEQETTGEETTGEETTDEETTGEETTDEETTDEKEAEADAKQEEKEALEHALDVPEETVTLELSFDSYPADAYGHEDLDLSEERVLAMYRNMLLQRRFEERCRQMYQQQKISGFLHLYIGQEAVSTGSVEAIRLGEDSVITAYRDHGIALAMEIPPRECMAELFGKKSGCSRGKGGSMHLFSEKQRMFGGHAIVGAAVPLGVGIAFAHKYREEDNICLCFFGDGAVQQGAFHEAANLAGLYDLPVVLICENNQYGMGTHIERAAAEPDIYKHAFSHNMPGSVASGMDVFSVQKAVADHVEMAREGQPSLLELKTYRYQGHSISDPATYRAEGELEEKREQGALVRLKKYILDNDLEEEEALGKTDEEVKQEVMEAIEFAEESDFPDEEALYEDVYTQDDYPFIR